MSVDVPAVLQEDLEHLQPIARRVQLRPKRDDALAVRNRRRSSLFLALGANPDAFDSARRRLSNVGDAFSRRISRTIGWRSLSESVELTVSQVGLLYTIGAEFLGVPSGYVGFGRMTWWWERTLSMTKSCL